MKEKYDVPIFLTKLECPVCKTINEVETIKVGAYSEEGRDTDFGPKKRVWQNPNYQRFNPLLYFMTTCSKCFYTREFTSKYKDWKSDLAFRNYGLKTQKEEHLAELETEKSILRKLGQGLDSRGYPFATAVNKLLLGIYDEKFNRKCSHLDIGRYFLRIAWMYREYSENSSGEAGQLSSHAINIEDVVLRLGRLYDQVKEQAELLQRATNDFLADGLFPDGDKKTNLTTCYASAQADLAFALEKYQGAVVTLKQSLPISSEVMSEFSSSVAPIDRPFGSHKSYVTFLRELKSHWDEIPLSEQEALNYAAKYYRIAYEEGNEIAAGNQAIQAVYLIAELSRRIGKNEDARGFFNTAIKLAQEYIHQNQGDKSRTALASKVLELAFAQGKLNLQALEKNAHVSA